MQFLVSAAIYYAAAVALIASAASIVRQENGDYGRYQLIQADGSCLTPNVTFGPNGEYTLENGTAVIAGECQPEAASTFLWLMQPQTPSSIEVSESNGFNSGFCLDAGSDPANGVAMKLWKCFDGLFQQTWWQTADNRTAIYNGNQCLDLALGSTTFVQTWQCTTGDIQQEWFANGPIHIN